MPEVIKVERLNLSEKSKLLSFLKVAYKGNPRQSDENFWDWHFLEMPNANSSEIPVWVAKSGEKIVGQLAAIPIEVNVNNEQIKASWIVDFIVLKAFRRQGIGKKLVLAVQKCYPITMALGTDEQYTPFLLKSLGWKIGGEVPRFHKMLFPGVTIREISKFKILIKFTDLCFAPFRPRYDEKLLRNNNIRFIEYFDSDFDNLWREAHSQWDCAVLRNAKTLNWQYISQPNKKFDILGYYEKSQLLGCIVLFFRKRNSQGALPKASIADICYHPSKSSEIVDRLLKAALQLALERHTGGLVTDVLNPFIEEKLRRLGFWRVKSPLRLMIKADVHQEKIYNLKEWFLTRGDADISIFEDTNI